MPIEVCIPQGPAIDPIPAASERPFFSVMIPTYNSGQYFRETLQSVLDQDMGPDAMDIEVIDNCSTTDDPLQVIREVAGVRVKFYRQQANVGAIENFNTCIRRARGEWVHILHADDLVRPGFYQHAHRALLAHPYVGAFSSRHIFIDSDGTWLSFSELQATKAGVLGRDFIERQIAGQRLHFVSFIIRRSVYEKRGGFRRYFAHCADWDMWNRVVMTERVYYDPELLACNRLHTEAATSHMIRTGENVRDERRCVRTYCSLLPQAQGKRLYRIGMYIAGIRALRHALHYWRRGERYTARHQFLESLRCCLSALTIAVSWKGTQRLT